MIVALPTSTIAISVYTHKHFPICLNWTLHIWTYLLIALIARQGVIVEYYVCPIRCGCTRFFIQFKCNSVRICVYRCAYMCACVPFIMYSDFNQFVKFMAKPTCFKIIYLSYVFEHTHAYHSLHDKMMENMTKCIYLALITTLLPLTIDGVGTVHTLCTYPLQLNFEQNSEGRQKWAKNCTQKFDLFPLKLRNV